MELIDSKHVLASCEQEPADLSTDIRHPLAPTWSADYWGGTGRKGKEKERRERDVREEEGREGLDW